MYMLDTNIIIYAIKNKPKRVLENISAHEPSEVCISSITYAELVYGVEKSKAVEKNWLALGLMLSNIKILDFDSKAAEEYGKIRTDLELKGKTIGNMDMLIAAHAKSQNLTIVTNNTKELERIKEIKIENWAS